MLQKLAQMLDLGAYAEPSNTSLRALWCSAAYAI